MSVYLCLINRWFDKPYNHIFTSSGQRQYLMEHACGDGMTGVHMFTLTAEEMARNPSVNSDTVTKDIDSSQAVQKLGVILKIVIRLLKCNSV